MVINQIIPLINLKLQDPKYILEDPEELIREIESLINSEKVVTISDCAK